MVWVGRLHCSQRRWLQCSVGEHIGTPRPFPCVILLCTSICRVRLFGILFWMFGSQFCRSSLLFVYQWVHLKSTTSCHDLLEEGGAAGSTLHQINKQEQQRLYSSDWCGLLSYNGQPSPSVFCAWHQTLCITVLLAFFKTIKL